MSVCLCVSKAQAQMPPSTPGVLGNVRDTTANKTNNTQWKDESAVVWYKMLNAAKRYYPDTSIHTFHRRPFLQPWNRDLGNMGGAARNLYFTPEYRVGPTLGYRAYDIYRYEVDSVPYYNTTRPYSVFTYRLGSKLEQVSRLMHSQNINPFWNITGQYQKINSQGFYKVQRSNHDNAFLSTNYKSRKQHYELNAAFTFNKEQQDENGGITDVTLLADDQYNDRKVIPINFETGFSDKRSAISNMTRDMSVLLNHSYTVGQEDTLYNEDSTSLRYRLIPRFRITHRMEYRAEKHVYKDLRPDSLRYTGFFEASFVQNDSVYSEQRWNKIDNRVLLNGYFGQPGKQLAFSAGVGNRFDVFQTRFKTQPEAPHNRSTTSNYIIGEIRKEILEEGQWGYNVNAQFYVTGRSAGDLFFHASVEKNMKNFGTLNAGIQQQLQSSPYNYSFYANQYYQDSTFKVFDKESITQIYLNLYSDKLHLWGGVRNYAIANYMFLNSDLENSQYKPTFSVTQVWLRKQFNFGKFVFDNEITYQERTGNAPVNIPRLMGRHQFAFESYMFKHALKVAIGVEGRYHSPYSSAGYSPFRNRYYYQDAISISNTPEATVFFNFKIKQFRATIGLDQVQQYFTTNIITTPNYPGQDAMLRFGFTWGLVN
jgi:hypothetical protein